MDDETAATGVVTVVIPTVETGILTAALITGAAALAVVLITGAVVAI